MLLNKTQTQNQFFLWFGTVKHPPQILDDMRTIQTFFFFFS